MSFGSYEEVKSSHDRTKVSYYTKLQSYLTRQIAQLNSNNAESSNDTEDSTQDQLYTFHDNYGHIANELIKITSKLYQTLENIDRLSYKVDDINNEVKFRADEHDLLEIDGLSTTYNAFVNTLGDRQFSVDREEEVEKLKIILAVVYERKRNFDLESNCIEAAQKSIEHIFSNEINVQKLASASAEDIKTQTRRMRGDNIEIRRKFDEIEESAMRTSCFMRAEHDLFLIYHTAFEERLLTIESAKNFQDRILNLIDDRYIKRLKSITITMHYTEQSLRDMVDSPLQKLNLLFVENARICEKLKDAIVDQNDNDQSASTGNNHLSKTIGRSPSTKTLPQMFTNLLVSWDKAAYLQNSRRLRNSAQNIIRKICVATEDVESKLLNIINMPSDR